MLNCITYRTGFVPEPELAFEALWNELDWERRGSTPRREYYCNEVDMPYVYGRDAGRREYLPRPWHPVLGDIKRRAEEALGTRFEVAFVNGYADARDHLFWHADDSPEMDDARPIAIISLGARREIWFCPNTDRTDVTRLMLESGSLCVMAAGMQDTHLHRIPKAGYGCGARISITLRGLAPASDAQKSIPLKDTA